MKYKTTQKEIKSNFGIVVSTGYCNLQNLFNYVDPESYTCGVYGWNADIYGFGGTAIVTGYRPFGKSLNYEVVREYDLKAEKIVNNWNLSWEEKKPLMESLVADFIKWIRENY